MIDRDVSPSLKMDTIKTRKNVPLSGMTTQNKHIRFFDNSSLENMRVCPRKFYFSQIRHFTPKGLRLPLVFGSAIHSSMDYIWAECRNLTDVDLLSGAMTEFLKIWKAEGADKLDEFDIFPRTPGRAISILEAYIDRYKTQLCSHDLIGVEQPFIVPLSLEDETVFYIGKLDKVIEDRYGIQIVDHKTASSMTTTWVNSFSPSGQMDGYLHAGHTSYGEKFHGVLIDGILVSKTKLDFMRVPLQRQISQLDAWQWEVVDLIDLIELNEERLIEYRESGSKLNYLPAFPKCTTSCTQYFGTCPYLDLCKYWDDPDQHECPDNMEVKKWQPFSILENLDGTFRVEELTHT